MTARVRSGVAVERDKVPTVGDERLRRCRAVPSRELRVSPPVPAARASSAPRALSPFPAAATAAMSERPLGPPVVLCQDSPKRVLVSVIKTTPIKPSQRRDGEEPVSAPPVPTSPGFSDFMVYPWRWGENAHNVTLSPGGPAAAPVPSPVQQPCSAVAGDPTRDDEESGSPSGGGRHQHLKVSTATLERARAAGGCRRN